jgi:hypothetical protein
LYFIRQHYFDQLWLKSKTGYNLTEYHSLLIALGTFIFTKPNNTNASSPPSMPVVSLKITRNHPTSSQRLFPEYNSSVNSPSVHPRH